jgi:hypothetical protein
VHAVDCARAAQQRLPAGAFHELRYEDLVADPRAELVRLCDFLGEDFEEAMLAPQAEAARLPARQRTGWHKETQGEVGTRRVGTYAGVLDAAEVALVEAVAGSRMRRHGYELPPGTPSAPFSPRLEVAVRLASMRLRTAAHALRDRWLARGDVAAR